MKKLIVVMSLASTYMNADICVNKIINNSTSTIYQYNNQTVDPGQSITISEKLKANSSGFIIKAPAGYVKDGKLVFGIGSGKIFYTSRAATGGTANPIIIYNLFTGQNFQLSVKDGASYTITITDETVTFNPAGSC